MSIVLYKVGGSLLSLPDLDVRLRRLLAGQRGVRPLLMVGGGPTADVVREWDRLHGLGPEQSHWLALWSMTLNERLLTVLLPETCPVEDRQAAEKAWDDGRWPILSAYAYLRNEEQPAAVSLPHSWDVTSDSLAAWVAIHWPAAELVLLKSTDRPASMRVESPTAADLLDAYFHRLAPLVPRIRWVNLRDDSPLLRQAGSGTTLSS